MKHSKSCKRYRCVLWEDCNGRDRYTTIPQDGMRYYRFTMLSQSSRGVTSNFSMMKPRAAHIDLNRELSADSEIAVVAAGRLGASLAVALSRVGRNVVAVSSRRAGHRGWLADALDAAMACHGGDNARSRSVQVCQDAREAVSYAKVVFVTSSDGAIAEVAGSCELQAGQYVAHFSGLQGADVLAEAAPQATAGAMHPLQTFPSPDSADLLLNGISFGIESPDAAFRAWLCGIAGDFGGRVVHLRGDADRAAYHAAAVMACGLLAGWTGLAADMWGAFGIPRDEALHHMAPMLESTVSAVSQMGIPAAMSGPFVRGDVDTIIAHLDATSRAGQDVGRAYAALALAQLPLAAAKGTLDVAVV